MYVCIYVCVYMCVYLSLYIYIYIFIHKHTDIHEPSAPGQRTATTGIDLVGLRPMQTSCPAPNEKKRPTTGGAACLTLLV